MLLYSPRGAPRCSGQSPITQSRASLLAASAAVAAVAAYVVAVIVVTVLTRVVVVVTVMMLYLPRDAPHCSGQSPVKRVDRSHAHAHDSRTNHSHEHRMSNGATTLQSTVIQRRACILGTADAIAAAAAYVRVRPKC